MPNQHGRRLFAVELGNLRAQPACLLRSVHQPPCVLLLVAGVEPATLACDVPGIPSRLGDTQVSRSNQLNYTNTGDGWHEALSFSCSLFGSPQPSFVLLPVFPGLSCRPALLYRAPCGLIDSHGFVALPPFPSTALHVVGNGEPPV